MPREVSQWLCGQRMWEGCPSRERGSDAALGVGAKVFPEEAGGRQKKANAVCGVSTCSYATHSAGAKYMRCMRSVCIWCVCV